MIARILLRTLLSKRDLRIIEKSLVRYDTDVLHGKVYLENEQNAKELKNIEKLNNKLNRIFGNYFNIYR